MIRKGPGTMTMDQANKHVEAFEQLAYEMRQLATRSRALIAKAIESDSHATASQIERMRKIEEKLSDLVDQLERFDDRLILSQPVIL